MSGLYENQKTIRSLRAKINELRPKDNEQYYFVFGFPRSDIGKGTLIAQLLNCTENSDAIKFDGLLNTNANGRHTAPGHDDFGVYEKFNPTKRWGREHYLLGGELYRDFIAEYGENENLQINPHFSCYVEYRIHKMWNDIGCPKNLFIEVGGLITDPEVDPIFTPILQRMQLYSSARTILLSELGWNDEYIKTKTIQDAVEVFSIRNIVPFCLMVREPLDIPNVSTAERLEFERVVMRKIYNKFNFYLSRIISIPYFDDMKEYTSYIKKRFLPLISNSSKRQIVIATSNLSKYADYKLYLGDKYELFSLSDLGQKLDVREGIDSIEDNAIAKARACAIATGMVSLGDDTGFFIEELNGEPGVALRRWGGELPDNASSLDFWKYLQNKTKNLHNYDCYFDQCVAVVSPSGDIKIVHNRNEGKLNKEKLRADYNGSGYPLGAAFESHNRDKTWDEMSDDEKRGFDREFIHGLMDAIEALK